MKDVYIWMIAIFVLIAIVSATIFSINRSYQIQETRTQCFEEIALNYCKDRGWVSLGINTQMTQFRCGETERRLWSDGYGYRFIDEEIERCRNAVGGEHD